MASIKNTISIAGGVINYLVIVIYKTTAPLAEVARVVYTSGVDTNPFSFEFTDLVNGTYIVKVHESTDGITLGNIRHDYWIDASTGQILQERIFFTVGGGGTAPANGTSIFSDPLYNGKNITGVFQEGFRYLKDLIEWQEYAGGGFELLSGIVFNDGQTWSFEISYNVIETAPAPDDAFADIVILTTNTTLNSSHYNKTILVNSSANKQTTTLPNIAGVPDGKGFIIRHDGNNVINVVVTGGTYRFRGSDVSTIYLGKGEMIKVVKKTISAVAKWYVNDMNGQWDRIGLIEPGMMALDNTIVCDTTEYDGTVYARAWDYITNKLPAAQKVTYATYDTTQVINGETVYSKRGFFAVDNVNTKFKCPDLRNQSFRFVKNIGGADSSRVDNVPGGYQHWLVGNHTHGGGILPHIGPGGYIEGYGGNNAPGSDNYDPGTTGGTINGQENTTRNTGMLPLLLI
jgi:hypothetical protein